MMRSLYSGVAGLKVHQTKMDVIGNNIANVNTVGFKSSSVNFSDVLYQTTQVASGANESMGMTGRNPKQIGIGSQVASITSTVSTTGGTQRTDNALDCMISGEAFFIVNYGGNNYYTKAGSFNVDASGTLCTAAGAAVMGWPVNAEGTDIERKEVQRLTVMSPENMTSQPEATTKGYITGNVDASDTQLQSDNGVAMQVNFYDNIGNSYNLKLSMKSTDTEGEYTVVATDILDSEGQSIFWTLDTDGVTKKETGIKNFTFAGEAYTAEIDTTTNELKIEAANPAILKFNTATGGFVGIGKDATNLSDAIELDIEPTKDDSPFETFSLDFSTITQYASNGKCALESQRGAVDGSGLGAGRTMGEMVGLSVDTSGKIYGSYDNGTTKMLGQIAVATFANATGLEAIGDSMFATTQNSGGFDGIGKDITETGGSLTTGVLEMSNVDLATEFTQMITTQRGFQANSRIITTSDTMLEELISLKR